MFEWNNRRILLSYLPTYTITIIYSSNINIVCVQTSVALCKWLAILIRHQPFIYLDFYATCARNERFPVQLWLNLGIYML